MSKPLVSGVSPEIMTALPRADGATSSAGVAPIHTNLAQGSVGYAIALQTPPDRGGAQLPLTLDYDPRRNGNGAFGIGWGVAIPFIERRTDRGVPAYDGNDRFGLGDGGPLEPVGDGEFRPLVERDFRRIHFVDPYWEITETDGTVLTFGDTVDSRLSDPAHPGHVSAWHLSHRSDPNGNLIRYRYRRDPAVQRPEGYAAAQLYPHQIEYVVTGGGHLCTVRFDYETHRPDAWTSHRTGFPVRTNWLCRQIVALVGNIDGQADHVLDFDGAGWDVAHRDTAADDSFVAHGVYVRSRAADAALTVEWPIPLSQARMSLAVPAAGARYRITETRATGQATREESAAPGYQIVLGDGVERVDIAALSGPLVVTSMSWPGALVPEVYARYRLGYTPIIGEVPLDRARVAPPTRLLRSVERAGYDDARREARQPPITMTYQPFAVAGTFPRPLRGTPNEALGAQATPLAFFGTGRPDLIQTSGAHRVYLNRGRLGLDIALERVDLVHSPSTQLGDPGVFLRDIEGRGAVDLSTTSLYYRNPSALGPVSRTAPSWGTAVAFDALARHPELSPTELRRARSLDLDGDGQIDLLVTGDDLEEWSNLGSGAWAPVRRVPRTASFGDKLFPDVSFDDAAVFVADMNGDGRDEIVRVSARKVEYWARSGDGWTFKHTMRSAPRYADFDPSRVLLTDLTGNGAADLIYLTGNGVDLVVNIGGSRFATPIRLDFTDEGLSRGTPMPTSAAAALAVDLLGDGTRGILWSFPRADLEPNYFYLPLCTAGRPYLLAAFDNGTGGRVELLYSTSSLMAAEDEANGTPWTDEPPYPVTVVSEVREIDQITSTRLVRRLRYRDGYYDRDDRSFRGFATVEETVVGTAARRGGRIVHRFASGRPSSSSVEDRAVARASAGSELSTAYFDLATGALLHRIDLQVETSLVRAFETGAAVADPLVTTGGERVAFTWERRRLESWYEGTAQPRHSLTEQSRLVTIDGVDVLDDYGRVRTEWSYGEVVPAGTATPVATFVLDSSPVALAVADPNRQRRVVYSYAQDRAQHLVRHRSREVTMAGPALETVFAETRRFFDGGAAADDSLPLGQVSQGNVQREERLVAVATDVQTVVGTAAARLVDAEGPAWLRAGTTADGRAGWFAVERRRVFQRSGGRIEFGAVAQDVDAAGNAVVRTFDAATWFLRRERNALNQVIDHQTMSYRAARPRRTVLASGSTTATAIDEFGRVHAVTEDAGAVPLAQVTTDRNQNAFVVTGKPTSETVSRVIDRTETPVRHVVDVTYFDGWGRVVQTRRSSQSHGTDYVVVDRRYEAGGQEPSFESLPYFSPGADYTPPGTRPGVSRHRDALSRVTRIVFPDGREARLDYAPWQTTVTDPEDADPGSANSATPTRYRFDFARNVVEVTTTVKNGSGAGSSAVATTRYGYDAADRLVQIVDARGGTTDLVLDARGDVLRLRHPDAGDTLRLVDAHRRRIYQHDAAGNEWWYGYDALGRPKGEVPGPDPGGPPAVMRGYDGTGTGTSVGRLTRAEVVPDGVVTAYTYNGRGQVESVTRTIGGATVTSDTMAYDDLGGISRQTFKGGAALDWSRGRDGLLTSVHLRRPDGSVVPMVDGVTYHPSGRVAAAQIGQGKVTFGASFDAGTHRLASRGYFDQAGAPLYRLSKLSYDGVGNIRGYDEDAPPAGTVSWTLAYDSLYRLRGATATRGGARLAALEYWHDLASNVTRSDETAPGQTLGYDPVRPDLVTGIAGVAAQYTYDAAGRVRSTPTTSDIRWGARDRVERLTSAGAPQVDLVYDHDRELLAADTITGGATVRSYFFSAVHERHGGVDYYFAPIDGRQAVAAREDGTCVVLARGMADSIARTIDGSGTVVAGSTELYAPFGTAVEAASKPWPRGFAGAVRAPNGVYLMGARPYLSGLGQFGAPDPVLLDPLPKDLLFDPRRISPYGYALANPHAFVDPTGRLAFIDDAVFYLIGRAAGVRSDPPWEGIMQNFKESWSVVLRSVFPFHSGTTVGQVAAWPVQVTWGLLGLIVGTIAGYGAVEVMGATTRMEEHVQLIGIPGSAGNWAFTVGNKVVGYEPTLKGHWHHEQGHYFQNLLLGPLYFPLIALPSVIHDKVHHIVHPGASLDDFYTEHWATAWG